MVALETVGDVVFEDVSGWFFELLSSIAFLSASARHPDRRNNAIKFNTRTAGAKRQQTFHILVV